MAERSAHALLLLAVVLVLYARFGNPRNDDVENEIAVGDRLASVEDRLGMSTGGRLLLGLSPRCPYCQRSLPFYASVTELLDSKGLDIGIVAVVDTSESVRMQSATLQNAGVGVDTIAALPFAELGIIRVPTVAYLDERGTVTDMWIGLLEAERQDEVLTRLER